MRKNLSVIIPAYNESRKITQTLTEAADYLIQKQYEFELIVVNDGSADDTAGEVRRLAQRFPQIKLIDNKINAGKGKAVKEGVSQARYPYCLYMDADNSTSVREWDKFEKVFEGGAKAAIASRHLPGSKITRPQPLARRFFGAGYRALCRILFGISVSDSNCGFKAYETALAQRVYSRTVMNDWTFDVEVMCRLKKEGVFVVEVPVVWAHESKKSNASLDRTILKTLFTVLSSVFRLKLLLSRSEG